MYRAGTKVNPRRSPAPPPSSTPAPPLADFTSARSWAAPRSRATRSTPSSSGPATGRADLPARRRHTPDGVSTAYEANDASVGDLDGDGAPDIVLKWQPTNAKDNSQSGYTGNTIVDGVKLDSTRQL